MTMMMMLLPMLLGLVPLAFALYAGSTASPAYARVSSRDPRRRVYPQRRDFSDDTE
jgi:hypothetical protein